ncbi:MAG: hypothetical protein AAFW97_13110 [Pseudomonadota bacterium]
MTDIERAREIAGRTLEEWAEHAKRDDCLDRMVPSDLRQIIGAALRAAPASDAGLLRHFREMQDMCARWLQPEPYKDRDGVVWPHGSHEAFVNDMIWMLDGPEQRAAEQALSTPADTEKENRDAD